MKVFDRGFGNRLPVEIQGNEGDFLTAKPPTPKPCIDDARRYSGCDAAKRSRCAFFANGEKQPGCTLYSQARYKTIYRPGKAWGKPAIDPKDLDGFSIEEAS